MSDVVDMKLERQMVTWLRDLLIGATFVGLYVSLERLTRVHELDGLGITLWNPVKALALGLLLLKGPSFAPLLFLAALLADLFIYSAAKSVVSMIATNLVVAVGYALLAAGLTHGLRFKLQRPDLRNVIALLVAVPAGTFFIAGLYCSLLVVLGDLPVNGYWSAFQHLWVGDTVGILIVLPVAMVALDATHRPVEIRRMVVLLDVSVCLAGVIGALWLIFGFERANEFHFFYLLFLPAIWIAMRAGFAGAALGMCVAHLLIVGAISWGGYPAATFMSYQLLVLALVSTALLLGAAVDERARSDRMLRAQHAELARMARHATAGAMGVSLAHQISQPLSNVAMYLHVGRQLLAGNPAERGPVGDAMAKAAEQLRAAKEILERLRDFVSRGTLRSAPADIGALARKVVALAEDDARAHGISMRLEVEPVPEVTVDALQVEQAIVNLLNNAVDAVADAASSAGVITIRVLRTAGGVRLEVEDNGPGIAQDIAGSLFEPFVTTKAAGMGLGLALSRELISAQGGSIRWERVTPAHGARFVVELPERLETDHGA